MRGAFERLTARVVARRRELPGLALLVAFLMIGFDLVNSLAPLRTSRALADGRSVLDLEHRLHLDPEVWASHWLLAHRTVALVANWTYNLCQVMGTGVVLVTVWWFAPRAWRRLRWVLLGTNLVALVVFWSYPVAPPRLVPGSGVLDTIGLLRVPFGWAPGITPGDPGQFQALPSLHMAWASWVALAALTASRRRWVHALGALYVTLIAAVVVFTGAHSVIDVVTGVATTAVLAVVLRVWRVTGRTVEERAWPYPREDVSDRVAVPERDGVAVRGGIGAWTSASSPSRSRARPTTTS